MTEQGQEGPGGPEGGEPTVESDGESAVDGTSKEDEGENEDEFDVLNAEKPDPAELDSDSVESVPDGTATPSRAGSGFTFESDSPSTAKKADEGSEDDTPESDPQNQSDERLESEEPLPDDEDSVVEELAATDQSEADERRPGFLDGTPKKTVSYPMGWDDDGEDPEVGSAHDIEQAGSSTQPPESEKRDNDAQEYTNSDNTEQEASVEINDADREAEDSDGIAPPSPASDGEKTASATDPFQEVIGDSADTDAKDKGDSDDEYPSGEGLSAPSVETDTSLDDIDWEDQQEGTSTTVPLPEERASPSEAGIDLNVDSLSETPITQNEAFHGDSGRLTFPFRSQIQELLEYPNVGLAEHYWLNPPHTYAAILYSSRDQAESPHRSEPTREGGPDEDAKLEYLYYVVEPPLTEFERSLYEDLSGHIRQNILYRIDERSDEKADKEAKIEEVAWDAIDKFGVDIEEPAMEKLIYYLRRDLVNYGKLDPLMEDPYLEEISVDGPDTPVFVFHRDYENIATNISYGDPTELRSLVEKLAQRSGSDISIADPNQSTDLPDGSRAHLTLGDEVTAHGSSITIRKFSEEPFTPIDLIEKNTYTVGQMAYLWLLIESGHNGIIAGGTGTGKTTTMNALSMFIPPRNKIVSIEDTREIELPHENWVAAITRESALQDEDQSIEMYELLRAALRMRPEYLIVGEIRGDDRNQGREANTLFNAMSSGHYTYSTMHADSTQSAINRLENPPMSIARQMLSMLDFVIIQSETRANGEKERRLAELSETYLKETEMNEQTVDWNTIYRWQEATDKFAQEDPSRALREIESRGINTEQELDRREAVLTYLYQKGITDYYHVGLALRAYMMAPDVVYEQVRDKELDFDELQEINESGLQVR